MNKNRLISDALTAAAKQFPDRESLYCGEEAISYLELDQISDHLASAWLELGLKRGDRIAIIATTQLEWLYCYFAAAKLGIALVGLNVRYRDSELIYMLNQSRAKALITLRSYGEIDYPDYLEAIHSKLHHLQHIVYLSGPFSDGELNFNEQLDQPIDVARLNAAKALTKPEDVVSVIYTSGTTGQPKGVAITQRSQLASAQAQQQHLKNDSDYCMVIPLPLNHVGGITAGVLNVLVGAGSLVLMPEFDPNQYIELMCRLKSQVMVGVPTIYTLMMMQESFAALQKNDIRLIIVGGSNVQPSLGEALQSKFPDAVIMSLYGLSETSGASHMTAWSENCFDKAGNIGRPLPGFEQRVVGPKGESLKTGEIGELQIRGEHVAAGYLDMPEKSQETFVDGWLKTGDLATVDAEGNTLLKGRDKEMYIQGGFNVYPVEIENILLQYPGVLMAAGVGIEDPVLGEIGCYYLVVDPANAPTEQALVAYCQQHLADYKVPRKIVFRDELPLTPAGKIMKSAL